MAQIDHTRLGYALKYRIDGLGLSYRQITKLTGVTVRQISHAVNGRPIDAGATYMLTQLCEINLFEMMPLKQQEALTRIRIEQQKHAVTPIDTHETRQETQSVSTPNASARRCKATPKAKADGYKKAVLGA